MDKSMTLAQRVKNLNGCSTKARKFLNSIIDENSLVEMDTFLSSTTILSEKALGEGVITGYASINDEPIYIAVQNSEVLGGSFSVAQADKIIKSINLAVRNEAPFIFVIDSNGARIGEGVEVLEGYSSLINALTIASAEIPVISVIKGNCVGMMSMIPALSDFVFGNKTSVISTNSPLVVKATANSDKENTEILGNEVHSTQSGLIDFTYTTGKDINKKLAEILNCFYSTSKTDDDPNRVSSALAKKVNFKNIVAGVSDDKKFIEYASKFAEDIKCGITSVNGVNCGFIICAEGDTKLNKASINKMSKFIKLMEKFDLPVVNFVNSNGLEVSLDDEQNGIAFDIANLMKQIAESTISKISIVYGKAVGLSYSLFASKSLGYDYTFAINNSSITPVDANVAVNVMYSEELANAKDVAKARQDIANRYTEIQGNPFNTAELGFVDNVIEAQNIRPYLSSVLLMLTGM